MTVRINKQKINLREKLAGVEDKVNFDEVVRGLGENTAPLILNKDGGNVGIGTASPSAKLDIYTTGASAWGLKVRTDNGDADSIKLVGGGGDSDVKFVVKGSGNVGIGTTSPGAKLQVNTFTDVTSTTVTCINGQNTISLSEDLTSKLSAGDTIRFNNPNAGDVSNKEYVVSSITSSLLTLTENLSFSASLYISKKKSTLSVTGGNVGIGTTSPANYKLNVQSTSEIVPIKGYRKTTNSGSYLISLNSNVGGTDVGKFRVEADGDVISATNSYGSDERLKTEISDLGYGLDTINQLSPKQFKMLHSKEKGFKYGFIAQDVEDILPDIVRQQGLEDGEGGYYKALEYNSMIAVLTKAIQEQQTIIEDLKSRIETLEQQ